MSSAEMVDVCVYLSARVLCLILPNSLSNTSTRYKIGQDNDYFVN